MTPYYQKDGMTIFHGDCREIMPHLEAHALITDPVWPNAHPDLAGAQDPFGLFSSMLEVVPSSVRRLVVWLGCQSDPRFLRSVPERLPFLRMQYLRRAVPSYNGRCLVSGDAAYAFGDWPAPREGAMVIPGEASATSVPGKRKRHPCARNEGHARWIVKFWCADLETVLDPFMGTGTTLRACKDLGRPGIGIEVEEKYCEMAARGLDQRVLEFAE